MYDPRCLSVGRLVRLFGLSVIFSNMGGGKLHFHAPIVALVIVISCVYMLNIQQKTWSTLQV